MRQHYSQPLYMTKGLWLKMILQGIIIAQFVHRRICFRKGLGNTPAILAHLALAGFKARKRFIDFLNKFFEPGAIPL